MSNKSRSGVQRVVWQGGESPSASPFSDGVKHQALLTRFVLARRVVKEMTAGSGGRVQWCSGGHWTRRLGLMMLRCSAVSKNIRAGELRAALTSDSALGALSWREESLGGQHGTEALTNVQKALRVTTTPDHGGRDSSLMLYHTHTSRLLCARSRTHRGKSSHTGRALETDSY